MRECFLYTGSVYVHPHEENTPGIYDALSVASVSLNSLRYKTHSVMVSTNVFRTIPKNVYTKWYIARCDDAHFA